MKLFYRGIEYNRKPLPIDIQEEDLIAKYRGRTYRVNRYPRHLPVPQSPMDLRYRGIEYKTHQCDEPTYPGLQRPTHQLQSAQSELTIELAAAHCQNILKSLEHRLQVAQDKGDRTLVSQLERERNELYNGGFCSLGFQ
ncbi:DUF4278 domain-containing protein [Roseofilum reptotaenium CS-1145]|uniref:DUF4278 domain-containing protein n=1 Tax=Roseofilum reptotaenium AO1-A TaxID=1925591 RepID=A0A1L9QPT6_9CYAN|nr:DUF4278 domain-containing protein [Roseofilum reptotaenium]MDB9515793.1 DUF4278 domain-containing protein [Roseofilum reptotaenium CS-1145]OJJ24607.1 hypothetical protein BI308_15760 [Roseofilum reptotaenium AO1-A]